jgi:hypothetical protein
MIGKNRKKQEEAEQNRDEKSTSILVGFRAVYVFDRLSRDLCPARLRHVSRATPVYYSTAD